MRSHNEIDLRSLALAHAVATKIDADPERRGLDRARSVCDRWIRNGAPSALLEWKAILSQSWQEVRDALVDPSEEGKRLRQSSPFCGILSTKERWDIYRGFQHNETA